MLDPRVRLRHRKSTFLWVALSAVVALTIPVGAQSPPRPGNHFVVLIDDSKDMEGFKSALERHLPGFLYDGGQGVNDRPHFEPARDSLSVVFFTVHPDGQRADRCPKARRYSVLPRYMFELADVGPSRVATKDAFRAQLREWLQLGCRFDGRLSPIATATSLVLPELGKSLPSDQRFARTILINATNGYFNSTASPGYELRNFLRIQDDINKGKLVRDVEATQRQLQAVAPLFRFESPEQWNLKISQPGGQPLYLSAFEAKPLVPTPEGLLTYRRQLPLDRVALSNEEIRLDAEIPGQSEIHITLPASDKAVRLVPTGLYWRFYQGRREELGQSEPRPWKVGSTSLPYDEQWLDLETCGTPCRVSDDKLTVPFIELAGGLTVRPRDHVPSESSTFEFSVTFRFDTGGSYDRLSLETRRQWIELRPVQPIEVPAGPFFPVKTLDNRALAELWRPGDAKSASAGLTQRVAADRVLATRDEYQLLILIGSVLGAVLLIVAVLYFLYKTAYQRPFEPRLEWQPAEEVLLDFDRPAASRMLTGTLRVVNPTEVPWFGQWLGNHEQPTRDASLEIDEPDFAHLGLEVKVSEGSAIGFLGKNGSGSSTRAVLTLHAVEPVSDGKRIYLFLAGEAVRDLTSVPKQSEFKELAVAVRSGVRMSWSGGKRGEARQVEGQVSFDLRIRPEAARPPEVRFHPAAGDNLHYQHHQAVQIGHFTFSSRARHRFAQAFEGDYFLRTRRDHRPLGGDPIALAESRLLLPPRKGRKVAASLICDGEIVSNPDPSEQCYELSLMGRANAASDPGPHRVVLLRDPTRAEIDLRVSYQGRDYEFFWTPDGEAACRPWQGGKPGLESPVSGLRHQFTRAFELPFSDDTLTPAILRLSVGNSATSGKGWVRVNVRRRLVFDDHYERNLHCDEGYNTGDLLGLYDRAQALGEGTLEEPHFLIREGEDAQIRTLKLETAHIDRIDGARIPASKCRLEVQLDVVVRDDQGLETRRRLDLVVPVELEQLPGLNWLCIDFGTSAIAAAVGNCSDDSFQLIRLQDIKLRGDSRLGDTDAGNQEKGTPFLPSWVVCDGDLRLQEPQQDNLKGWPEGFPLHQPASQVPGDPSFLGLPALSNQLVERPGRVVFSLKSWLGQSSRSIRLAEKVRYSLNGRQFHSNLIPLDAVVESGFAALTEAYIRRERQLKADQVAICYPNTFTSRHRKRLRGIAQSVLMRRLGVAAPHHIQLVSESDAVAYFYCSRRMREEPRSGSERILVYDFGAGTLDISIIRVEWQKNPFQPRTWTIEGRIGVPVAGNHIDEILARLIDRQLRSENVLANPALEYTYPLVDKAIRGNSRTRSKHRDAVYWVWQQIRAAKHAWDGRSPFVVGVGDTAAENGPVTFDQYKGDPLPTEPPLTPEVGIWTPEAGILLSIPPDLIRQDSRMLEFVNFASGEVVDEAMFNAGVKADQIDTVLISGRGALWPVLNERLVSRFGAKVRTDLLQASDAMKQAVTQGAIALQSLILEAGENQWSDQTRTRLGVLVGNREIVPEEDWAPDRPIDLSGSPTFRLVQIGLRDPDPRRDMTSLRRHFYVDLSDRPYRRDSLWRKNPKLFVEKSGEEGELTILLRNSDNQEVEAFADTDAMAAQPPHPPWPIGQILLDPDDS